jgi:hypothetical protein
MLRDGRALSKSDLARNVRFRLITPPEFARNFPGRLDSVVATMGRRVPSSIVSALAVIVAGLSALACSGEDDPPVSMGNSSSGSTCPPGSTLTYDNFGKTFLERYCVRCHGSDKVATDRHGAPTGYDWDQYESVALHANEIDAMAAGGPRQINRTMPPGEPLPSDAERRELGQWLACELDVGR